MVLDRNEEFLRKLITLSNENKISWEYLDSNIELCDDMKLRTYTPFASGDLYEYDFDKEGSFFTYQKDNNVYLVFVQSDSFGEENLELIVTPNTFRNALTINTEKYMELLVRLRNTIKSQFPNPDDFIDSILKM